MKVLVTGGTGFVGREILKTLHAAGHQPCLMARNPQSPAVQKLAAQYDLEVREGNVLNAASLARAMQGADAVIHLVGIISEVGDQTFENIHTRTAQRMANAAVTAGVRRFVHMSALGTRTNASSRYHQTKWAAEQIITESALEWTIFRPSLIYGPGDQFVNVFARMAEWSPWLPVFGNPRAVFQPVAVEDVAHCFVQALDEPRSIRHSFDLCGPDSLTIPQMLTAILKVTDRKSWIVPVSDDVAVPLAWLLEFVYAKILALAPPLNRDQLIMLREHNVGEIRWTLDLFKLNPMGFTEGIARYLKPARPTETTPRSRTP